MEKTCQKANCVNTYISRGKYCDKHRTKKKKIPSTISEEFESLKVIEDKKKEVELIKKTQFENDRLLRREQEEEYAEAVRQDMARMEQEELDKSVKLSIQQFYGELKVNIPIEPINTEDCYNIRIALSNGNKLNRKFPTDSIIRHIRDYIDVYFYENIISTTNYDLILNYPFRKLSIDDKDLKISSLDLPKSFTLYLSDLDA